MAKFLAGLNIADVNFDERDVDRQYRVTQGQTRMRESAGVDQDKYSFAAGSLNSLHQLRLGIALECFKLVAQLLRLPGQLFLHIGQGRRAVHPGFPAAQQVKIRAIE